MKMILLAAALTLGVAVVAPLSASAAPIGNGGIEQAAKANSLVEPAYYACRRIRVCERGYYGRRHCWWRRVCRHW
jgi:hypothetical protein